MSSILDALKKVERDKARQDYEEGPPPDPQTAEEELFGRGGGVAGLQMSTPAFVILSVTLLLLLVMVSVTTAFVVTRQMAAVPSQAPAALPAPDAKETISAHAPAIPEPGIEAPLRAESISFGESGETTASDRGPEAEGRWFADGASREDMTADSDPGSRMDAAPEAALDAVPEAGPAPAAAPPAAPPPPAQPPANNAPVEQLEMATLPPLSESMCEQMGLPRLNVNLTGNQRNGATRPHAWINMKKVYLNDAIHGTNGRVRLIGIDPTGVAVEIGGNRYFLEL